ncbi:MAG TPA: hypothetical protein VFU76_02150, partial [Terriglobales bacterium]|nr:hypothetical protein [Terriglobales bacterium]
EGEEVKMFRAIIALEPERHGATLFLGGDRKAKEEMPACQSRFLFQDEDREAEDRGTHPAKTAQG